jgi:subtilisin family serine protease
MSRYEFFSGGRLQTVSFRTIVDAARNQRDAGSSLAQELHCQARRLSSRFAEIAETKIQVQGSAARSTQLIPTESILLDGARKADIAYARNRHGFRVIQEGRFGKVLLQASGEEADRVGAAFRAAADVFRQRDVKACHPNFIRALRRPKRGRGAPADTMWNHDNPGAPGLIGADVHAPAAWTVTRGERSVRVAVLDEGVDTRHKYLRDVVVAEADFVDHRDHARPSRNDAHGTACAGIIVSQSERVPGLAAGVSLVAARIAKSDEDGYWIFDDFETADAIDWAWDEANADVLSNSWGGGPAVDGITRAFERATGRGRRGQGAVVVVAAGNDQARLDFPGTLSNVLTVGASNEWDERKTKRTRDGEDWWGSNFGPELDLVAPGVHIRSTDIAGSRGYTGGLYVDDFNGTSSAAPHVAAVAALMLSVNPKLEERRVRELLQQTCDPLDGQKKRSAQVGHGRLNAYLAVRAARRG